MPIILRPHERLRFLPRLLFWVLDVVLIVAARTHTFRPVRELERRRTVDEARELGDVRLGAMLAGG